MVDLTQKQIQVLNLRAEGKLNKQISNILEISEVTIHQHLSACCKKLEANNTAHAIAIAMHLGLIKVNSVREEKRNTVFEQNSEIETLNLTSRDQTILQRVAKGETNVQIAEFLGIQIRTLEVYFQRMAMRNGTRGRMSLAMSAVKSGQISLH